MRLTMQPLNREQLPQAKSTLPHPIGLHSYMSILSHFDPSITSLDPHALSSGVPIIGFSATFGRHDGLALGAIFDHIVYHHEISDMIRDKWFGLFSFIVQ
jgi:superfamily II DNA or RNA helicase